MHKWTFMAMWAIFFLLFAQTVFGYIEYVEVWSCESCALRLTCRDLESIIAVLEATFVLEDNKNESVPTPFPPMHPRTALNRRCSGVNHCSFILTKDCPGADGWGAGNLTVKYACVTERRVTKYCNRNITLPSPETLGISQGFVHNPGYPRYYLGRQACTWKIQAPPLQKVKVIIYDLSLVGSPSVNDCTDLIDVSDSGQTIYSSCKQREPPVEIISSGDTLEVTLVPSPNETLLPTRGVLFYYTALGCLTPTVPRDGYLVYRNDTTAEFRCCIGFVFPDTKKRRRIIKCLGHRWNASLPMPNCFNSKVIENAELQPVEVIHYDTRSRMMENNNFQEIVVPTIIMVGLFVLNSIILFVICKYRRRSEAELKEEEELTALPTNKNTFNIS